MCETRQKDPRPKQFKFSGGLYAIEPSSGGPSEGWMRRRSDAVYKEVREAYYRDAVTIIEEGRDND